MALSNTQKTKVLRIVNVFETGDPDGKYDSISIYKDATNKQGEKMYQITYGRSQTTEFGNLKRLLELYIARNGRFSTLFHGYISRIGQEPSLHTDAPFKQLLRQAAREDVIMRTSQDEFFDMYYYQPAFVWYRGFGFKEVLSLLVIYDSFIHSGTVPDFLRKRFAKRLPLNGGQEKAWIEQYVNVRHDWLATHSRPELRPTVYRTKCFKTQIQRNNWNLAEPVNANGMEV